MGGAGSDTHGGGHAPDAVPTHDVRELFEAHGDYVWRALARAGVRDADLRDATQEVFLVAARKEAEREGTSTVATWLYGIAVRIAANYRRRGYVRREELVGELPEPSAPVDAHEASPERAFEREEARVRLAAVLEALPPPLRVVFVMFELEELPCPAIATTLGLPLGTVYTRLRLARAAFVAQVKQLEEEAR